MLLWGEHEARDLDAARARHEALPKGSGELRIRELRVGTSDDGLVAFESLSFEAELCFPWALPDPLAIDWKAELARARRAQLDADCPDADDVSLARTSFGDLDGDGRDEVALTGLSCLAGTGGADLFALFRIDACGRTEELELDDPGAKPAPAGAFLRGHLGLSIEDGRVVREMPLYAEDDPNCCPTRGLRRVRQRLVGGGLGPQQVTDAASPALELR